MSDVTRLLEAAAAGDRRAAGDLLPLVYDELRKLAASRMAGESPGHTLDATALVHEAYLRLVGGQHFDGRGHFFAAAAEAMRRILVEQARRKAALKRGGDGARQELEPDLSVAPPRDALDTLAVHEMLDALAAESPRKAELVKLRYFLGCTMAETADVLGIAAKTAEEDWTYARAWLRRRWLREHHPPTD